ncbi:S-ADENOSYL-L-METHIONINE:CARBOXYL METHYLTRANSFERASE FAMILY PROTEIN [Salix viminalis]|uniref:S-ADENOSYL-L-METHIONINE:CARBOXYL METHYLTRANSFERASE FAMILY PROTEIN n=1 Tax=Salix viminalis TaxID=40686 RepID=A0A9Q0P9X7_SALVM|nr:S-ADENOSYL-L-METHIONINE:CARBOXYL METHYLTRANSFERASE FAMILY PROTEIN [Salix viminalis]
MSTFLEARAQEIVGGGLMVIITGGLPDGVLMSHAGIGMYYDLLGSRLIDMAELGVISEEKLDSFNLPLYYSSSKEIEEIIKANGNFSIERMDSLSHNIWKNVEGNQNQSLTLQGRVAFSWSPGRSLWKGSCRENI